MKNKLLLNICCLTLLIGGCATIQGDWEKASRFDSAVAYKSFLKEHGQSEYTSKAKEGLARLEDEEWEKAKRLHTLRGYKGFFHIYPDTKYISELKAKSKDLLCEIAIQESKNDPKLLNRSAGSKPIISIDASDNKTCEFLRLLGGSRSWGDAKSVEMEEYLTRVGMGSKIGTEVASIVMQGNSIPIKAYNDPTDILEFRYQEIENEKRCAIVYVSGTGLVVIGNYVQAFNIFYDKEKSNDVTQEKEINETASKLHDAVRRGDYTAIERLLDQGANIKELDKDGNTPLQVAIAEGQVGITRFLTEYETNLDAKNKIGQETNNQVKPKSGTIPGDNFQAEIEVVIKNHSSLVKSYPELNDFEEKLKQEVRQKDWWSKIMRYSQEWEQKGRPKLIVAFTVKNKISIPIKKNIDSSSPFFVPTQTKVVVRNGGNGLEYWGEVEYGQSGSSLRPKIWNPGARHTIDGKVIGWPAADFSIESDPKSPLMFVVMVGEVCYESGIGILEVKDGPTILLGVEDR